MADQEEDELAPVGIATVFTVVKAIVAAGEEAAFLAECQRDHHHLMASARTRAFTTAFLQKPDARGGMSAMSIQTGGCKE